jgi:hypothetical protein
MSMPTILTADPDDFRQWEAELDLSALEPLTGPKIPTQRSRAAGQRDARQQIDAALVDWQHGRGRRD